MAEVLLYGEIYSDSAQEFITAIEEAKGSDLTVRVNTSGGSPEYGWGMIAKFSEYKGKKLVKVDGKAHSMGAYYLCYAEDSEALDVSQMCIHRAAYAEWVESNPNYMTTSMWETLDSINGHLRKAFEAKVDVAKFEKIKGVKLDDIFSNSSRIDVHLTADEAKQIGLINRVVKLTPGIKAQIDSFAIAANVTVEKTTEKNTEMDINKIKAEHPALYAEIFASGETAGIAKEKSRVTAWSKFTSIDAEAVQKGIESGAEMNMEAIAGFTAKSLTTKALEDVATDSGATAVVKTGEITTTTTTEEAKKAKAIAEFEAEVNKHFNIKA